MMRKLQLLCCFFINLGVFCRGELFTALSDIEPLLTTHKRVAEDLHDYITKEEERLHILKRYLEVYQREHVKAMKDIPNYLGNPINAFTLIKRMTTDLEFVKLNIDLGVEHASNIGITQYEGATYPSAEDLRGAAFALSRLQETYLLKVEDLAEGILNGVINRIDINPNKPSNNTIAVSSAMSASDCYEFGKILFNENDYGRALYWLMAALHKLNEEYYFNSLEEIDILKYISLSYQFLGDIRDALKWANKILEIDPDHTDAIKNTIEYQKLIDAEEEKITLNGETDKVYVQKEENITLDTKNAGDNEHMLYNELCRGQVEVPSLISKQLKCRYLNENPFLKLAPIKMEYKYLNPDIVMFYEVLSDEEIETIKKIAQPRFKRATVRNAESGELTPVDYRISKSAWLTDAESPVVERVTRRVADFTGLDMGTAEYLQVVNYGIGGHYLPHYDHATSHDIPFPDNVGNRIATVIFYMSDVAQGGATVFTELGLSLFPVRGAAAVWLNLHASGEGDLATRHAACPVLRGSKWVSNKWIHLVGQEFRKPCGLEYQTEDMKRPSMKPVTKLLR